ncbi:MAG: hypothetical protein L6Q49_19210 [Anaerolineales bacterium]|nr:hypothetical protein [Anaerolineales bacterium]
MDSQRSRHYWRAASLPEMGKNKKAPHVSVAIRGDHPCGATFNLQPVTRNL